MPRRPSRDEMIRTLRYIKDTIQTRGDDLETNLDVVIALVDSGFYGFMNPVNREALARTYTLANLHYAMKEDDNGPDPEATGPTPDQRLAQ